MTRPALCGARENNANCHFRERGPDLWCYIAKQDLEAKVIAIEHDTPDNWGGAISLEGDASMSSACNPGDLPFPSACAPRAARFVKVVR
jgi:nitrogen fixation protein NifT